MGFRNTQEKLENKSSVRIPNDQGGPQTNLGSIWYHSEPSEVSFQKRENFLIFNSFNFQQSLESWRTVFLITSTIYFVGNTIFIIFLQTDVQTWNSYWEKSQTSKKEKNENGNQG